MGRAKLQQKGFTLIRIASFGGFKHLLQNVSQETGYFVILLKTGYPIMVGPYWKDFLCEPLVNDI